MLMMITQVLYLEVNERDYKARVTLQSMPSVWNKAEGQKHTSCSAVTDSLFLNGMALSATALTETQIRKILSQKILLIHILRTVEMKDIRNEYKSTQASHHIIFFQLKNKASAKQWKAIPKLTNAPLLCCHSGGRCVDATKGKLCLLFEALSDLLASGFLATWMPTKWAGLYSSGTAKAHFDRPEEAMSLANN